MRHPSWKMYCRFAKGLGRNKLIEAITNEVRIILRLGVLKERDMQALLIKLARRRYEEDRKVQQKRIDNDIAERALLEYGVPLRKEWETPEAGGGLTGVATDLGDHDDEET